MVTWACRAERLEILDEFEEWHLIQVLLPAPLLASALRGPHAQSRRTMPCRPVCARVLVTGAGCGTRTTTLCMHPARCQESRRFEIFSRALHVCTFAAY